jgi:hypothetical protein
MSKHRAEQAKDRPKKKLSAGERISLFSKVKGKKVA